MIRGYPASAGIAPGDTLVLHIATDGETYGHHHHFGEMALSYTLHHLYKEHQANLTIYDNREYRDQDKFLDAGANVANLSKEMGFFDNFRSMMLSCI